MTERDSIRRLTEWLSGLTPIDAGSEDAGLEADQSFNWYLIKQITGQVMVPKGGFGPATPADSTGVATDSLNAAPARPTGQSPAAPVAEPIPSVPPKKEN